MKYKDSAENQKLYKINKFRSFVYEVSFLWITLKVRSERFPALMKFIRKLINSLVVGDINLSDNQNEINLLKVHWVVFRMKYSRS